MTNRPAGLEAIILYKLIKAGLEVALVLFAVVLLLSGTEAGAATLAQVLLDHFTGGWSLEMATLIVRGATTAHVKFMAVAALADSILSAVEGLALAAGRWWAPWLVLGATAALLPWEIVELIRHPGWGRVLILVINIAVVVYLLRNNVRLHRAIDRGPLGS
jgi:uncharacterized membrane protein (DUF2068 family)